MDTNRAEEGGFKQSVSKAVVKGAETGPATQIFETELNLGSPLDILAGKIAAGIDPKNPGKTQIVTLASAKLFDLEELVKEIDANPPRPLESWKEINAKTGANGETYFERAGLLPIMEKKGCVTIALRAGQSMLDETLRSAPVTSEFIRENFNVRLKRSKIKVDEVRYLVVNNEDFINLAALAYDSTSRLEYLGGIDPDAAAEKVRDKTLTKAIESRASDIHIEPFADAYRIRLRVDGDLQTLYTIKRATGEALTNKIWRETTSSEEDPRKPADAQVIFSANDIARNPILDGFSLRLSKMPVTTEDGRTAPKLVMRLLTRKTEHGLDLDRLGLPKTILGRMREIARSPFGIFIVTGPTGSGKSTTLYSMLRSLNDDKRNILTVEDPVEVKLRGANQMQVNNKIGVGFPEAMRAALRQDPDIILVGEIRDKDSAKIAMQAAKTGHFVLSTLHTNNALEAVSRLRDWDLDAADIGTGLRGIMAQRLVKTLCESCSTSSDGRDELRRHFPDGIDDETQEALYGKPLKVRHPSDDSSSCKDCRGTGYLGRTVVPEVVVLDDTIRSLIANRVTDFDKLEEAALRAGYIPMGIQALEYIRAGTTSIEEAFRLFAPSDIRRQPKLIQAVMKR